MNTPNRVRVLHPEDRRYWRGWLLAGALVLVVARMVLVRPIVRAISQTCENVAHRPYV
jgi:hypothetical protein